jgi:hypothetical protein
MKFKKLLVFTMTTEVEEFHKILDGEKLLSGKFYRIQFKGISCAELN